MRGGEAGERRQRRGPLQAHGLLLLACLPPALLSARACSAVLVLAHPLSRAASILRVSSSPDHASQPLLRRLHKLARLNHSLHTLRDLHFPQRCLHNLNSLLQRRADERCVRRVLGGLEQKRQPVRAREQCRPVMTLGCGEFRGVSERVLRLLPPCAAHQRPGSGCLALGRRGCRELLLLALPLVEVLRQRQRIHARDFGDRHLLLLLLHGLAQRLRGLHDLALAPLRHPPLQPHHLL
mmetsp:Transcript_58371/g.137401  ORF Transcript_58371/g.137401 Transcript_58371/m.137401 type:complete len:238 (-) Transcript_58371:1012-1725(-)